MATERDYDEQAMSTLDSPAGVEGVAGGADVEGAAMGGASPRSKREEYMDRIRSYYPDVDYDDEDARYGAYLDYDDELRGKYDRLAESDEKLKEMFSRDPRFVDVMYDMANGEEPSVAFAKNYYDLMQEDMRDPEVAKRVAEVNQKRIEETAERERQEREDSERRERNLEESGEVISSFAEEHKLGDDEMGDLVDLFVRIADEGITGLVRKETLELLWKGMQYTQDVATAETRGLVDGRNERIELERKRTEGDGLPHPTGGNMESAVDDVEDVRPLRRPSMYDMK